MFFSDAGSRALRWKVVCRNCPFWTAALPTALPFSQTPPVAGVEATVLTLWSRSGSRGGLRHERKVPPKRHQERPISGL